MSLQVEKLEKNMAKLTIEASAEEFEAAVEKAYQKAKKSISLPGFRKGKAPRRMIEKMYGTGVFYEDAANALIPVEVKAQNGMAKSIRTLISGKKYADIHCGIKFTGSNMGYGEQIYTFPYFCAFLLKRYLAGVDEKAFLEGAYSKDSHISAGDEMN